MAHKRSFNIIDLATFDKSKLVWYRKGGEVSDRQWLDILNVLALQADSLDRAYLRQWAIELGVSDLLARATMATGQGDIDP